MARRSTGARPLEEAGPSIQALGYAAAQANYRAVKKATTRCHTIVAASGKRFHIKGRDGKPVPLEAVSNVREFRFKTGGGTITGLVRGVPWGFWRIVEDGSGKHLITTRGSRTTRSGRTVSRKYSWSKTLKLFGEGHSFGDLQPLGVRGKFGPYQYVQHPGHGSLGKPWASAMRTARPEVSKIIANECHTTLVKSWDDLGGTVKAHVVD